MGIEGADGGDDDDEEYESASSNDEGEPVAGKKRKVDK